jgi:bifunctional DNA-binding transcriptional regulator/antitoxin component of YhaV-PrlF toxin-antitoxin module
MRKVISATTTDGSVTISPHVRRRLGLRKNDKVSFIVEEDGKVELRATRKITILDHASTLPSLGRETEDFDDLIAEAMDDWIEREIKEGRL